MLTQIKVGQFRCFEKHELHFEPGTNLITGPNARGKTSLLEAVCVLLRLQSPRAPRLAEIIRHGQRGLLVDGFFEGKHLQFYFSPQRKKLALDSVEQRSASEYLRIGRVMWFSNTDIQLIRGSAELRRRLFDFVCVQLNPEYRAALRNYERALRSRNILLRSPVPVWREIRAFDEPLIESAKILLEARSAFVTALRPMAQIAHAAISGAREKLDLLYAPGVEGDFPSALTAARSEDSRLRQTTRGPHRDDLTLQLSDMPAALGSEGQQRTLVLALRLAAARLLEAHFGTPPLLLLDDIFGELDSARRSALLAHLPDNSQRIITTTQREWLPEGIPAHWIAL